MRRLLQLIAVIAMLCVWTDPALADDPALSAQPNVQPGPQSSTAGGSASASGGDAGPATVASSEPIGILGLPSTATEPAPVSLLGATLALAGLVLLHRTRRKS
jgi:LPXTG-motif cell wall-anchored protein